MWLLKQIFSPMGRKRKKTSMEIVPAIMPDSLEDFTQKSGRVSGVTEWAQIDVMDGEFVPSVSWPYHLEDTQEFVDIFEGRKALPGADMLSYEVDFMVSDPEGEIMKWARVPGVKRLIAHVETIKDIDLLEHFLVFFGGRDQEFGLAVGIDGPLDVIKHYIEDLDVVQCMGIQKIGYQGQDFDPKVIDTIRSLREASKDVIISVDGGVSLDTAEALASAGANRLVSGSAVFNSEDMADAIRELENRAEGF